MSGYYSVDARDEAVQRKRKGVAIITPEEAAINKDIAGRTLDRLHDIDGCNEYTPWHIRKRRL